LRHGLCTPLDFEKCEIENGDNLAWACEHCPTMRRENLMQYTVKLMNLRTLQAAGYPFTANDLTLEEWSDLGLVKEAFK
jgi:hypothetical protein